MFCDGRCVELHDRKGNPYWVSLEDVPRLAGRTWTVNVALGYVVCARERLYLHSFLLGARPPGHYADHRDQVRNHNCRGNLRWVVPAVNVQNSTRRVAASGYRGVQRGVSCTHRPWTTRVAGRYIGAFPTAIEAARAYDRAARERYGPEALCNFPLVGSEVVQEVQNQFALVVGQTAP